MFTTVVTSIGEEERDDEGGGEADARATIHQ